MFSKCSRLTSLSCLAPRSRALAGFATRKRCGSERRAIVSSGGIPHGSGLEETVLLLFFLFFLPGVGEEAHVRAPMDLAPCQTRVLTYCVTQRLARTPPSAHAEEWVSLPSRKLLNVACEWSHPGDDSPRLVRTPRLVRVQHLDPFGRGD